MTDVTSALVGAMDGINALRGIVTDLRKVVGDHQLLTDAENVIADIETAINTIPHEVSAGITLGEDVVESLWDKMKEGIDGLLGKHTARVTAAVNAHTAAVTEAVNTAVTTATPIATGPQPPGGAVRQVGGPSAGAPAATQPAPSAASTTGTAETVDTGKTISVDGETQSVHDSPQGPSENIVISG